MLMRIWETGDLHAAVIFGRTLLTCPLEVPSLPRRQRTWTLLVMSNRS